MFLAAFLYSYSASTSKNEAKMLKKVNNKYLVIQGTKIFYTFATDLK
jgi:hypothetical protein